MKRGKTRMYKSQLAFVLHLIGLEIGGKFLDQRDRPKSSKPLHSWINIDIQKNIALNLHVR